MTPTSQAKASNNALLEYDILSLLPTTTGTFSVACLKHSVPSSLTAHVISLPLTGPRLPFYFKHTLVRTALKNGAVLEVSGHLVNFMDSLSLARFAIVQQWVVPERLKGGTGGQLAGS